MTTNSLAGVLGTLCLLMGSAAWAQQPCATDTACPAPLTCKPKAHRVCTTTGYKDPDGGFVTSTTCEAATSVCTWTLVACSTDTDCSSYGRWKCLPLPAEGASSICFPEGIACSAGQACPTGWSCVDFSTVREDDMVEMWPPSGQTQYCFPDALRAVADHQAEVDSTQINPGRPKGEDAVSLLAPDAGSGAASAGGGQMTLDPGSAPSSPTVAASDAGPVATTTTPTKSSSSGCSLAGNAPAAFPLGLFIALAAFYVRRRR